MSKFLSCTYSSKVENELDRLEKENVIHKVEHSDWATPIVVVPKTNGPQFVSHVFKSFCEANGIKHTRVVPYHPQSNGAADGCVQTVKKSLKKYTKSHGISHAHWLANFLLRYRCTRASFLRRAIALARHHAPNCCARRVIFSAPRS